jgi:acetate kinase
VATRTVLVINAGSSSVKSALFTLAEPPQALARETIDTSGDGSYLPRVLQWVDSHAGSLAGIGHRIVHGGPSHREPLLLTRSVLHELQQLSPFAPNQLPAEITLVERLADRHPGIPQYACFDTAFHADLPDVVRRLPIPAAYDAQGVRRYGFHGLSYSYLLEEFRRLEGPDAAAGRLVLAHLGNGSSLAAVHHGRSIDTTMGFTPLGGVIMSTRSGDLDPGVVTYLARKEQLSADQLDSLLSYQCGLRAISGGTSDMRVLLDREAIDPASHLAVAMYVYAVKKAIGALAAAMGGIDALVYSGGIGEHAAPVRARICGGLSFLGMALDDGLNAANAPVISPPRARVTVHVIPTDEEITIARAARHLLM